MAPLPTATPLPVWSVLGSGLAAHGRRLEELLQAFRLAPKARLVHDLRVTSRRMLSTLRLIEALGVTVKPGARRRVKRVLRVLAPIRDAEVQLRALSDFDAVPPAALVSLRRRKRSTRRKAHRVLDELFSSKVSRALSELLEELGQLPSDSSTGAAANVVLMGELAKLHLGVARRIALGTTGEAGKLHTARLALKRYRYALEALDSLLPEPGKELAPKCQALQDELGKAQDAVVLARTVRALVEVAPADAQLAALLAQVDASRAQALTRATQALAGSGLSWPEPVESR